MHRDDMLRLALLRHTHSFPLERVVVKGGHAWTDALSESAQGPPGPQAPQALRTPEKGRWTRSDILEDVLSLCVLPNLNLIYESLDV